MTENKRFTLEWESDEVCQVYDNGDCMGTDEVVDLLNKLYEENQVLKVSNGEMEDYLARLEEKYNNVQSEYDASICEICKYANNYTWFDSYSSKTVYDMECCKGHKNGAETECNDFEMKI